VVSILYRPVEQLLSRTIADRDARGLAGRRHLRVAAALQLGLAALFVVAALVGRGPIEEGLFAGSAALYWILIGAVVAYGASYFTRGYLAGRRAFGRYGLLVLLEATSRCLFAVAVIAGIASGQTAVALGILAAPLVSLLVVFGGFGRRRGPPPLPPAPATGDPSATALPEDPAGLGAEPGAEPVSGRPPAPADGELTVARGGRFALAVLCVMLAEQTFLNAGPLLVKVTTGGDAGTVLAGIVFNVLLIVRAPMQLFQSIQTSILPHLTRLVATGEADPFRRSVNVTLVATAGFAAIVAVAMAALGPFLMGVFFPGEADYDRAGLVVVAVGMGLYLAAATLNQAALARDQAPQAAACWAATAAAFVAFLVAVRLEDRVLQVELGFFGGALVLSSLLFALYRRGATRATPA